MLRFALSPLFLAFLATTAPAMPAASDTVFPGYAPQGEHSIGVYDAFAILPNRDRIVFDGSSIWREAEDGTFLQLLGTVPTPVYASFVLANPAATFALVGESTRGKIFLVDLGGAGFYTLADLDFNFDARFEDAGHALVSAAPCGFSCGNEIYRLDLATGVTTLLASVTGPSGPIALAANGDLYYGVNPDYPAVTGSIVRWSAAQVSSGALLDEASAALLATGIVPVSSIEVEPVFGNLLVTQPVYGGTSRVAEYAPDGLFLGTVAESLEYLSGVSFQVTGGIGAFQAFQPEGVLLAYRATDYPAQTSAVRTIRTRRPRAFTSGPGLNGPGNVSFTVTGAQPNSSFLVLMGAASNYDPNETSYDFGHFLFHTGIPRTGIRRLGSVTTDAQGEGTFQFYNPGGLQGTRVFQAMIRDGNGLFVGSSTEAFN